MIYNPGAGKVRKTYPKEKMFGGNFANDREITADHFFTGNVLTNLAGPGNIDPALNGGTVFFGFNKVVPELINVYNPFVIDSGLSEYSSAWLLGFSGTNFIWASYDGRTNDP